MTCSAVTKMDRRRMGLVLRNTDEDTAWEIDHLLERYVYKGFMFLTTYNPDGTHRKVTDFDGEIRMPYPPARFAPPDDDESTMETDPSEGLSPPPVSTPPPPGPDSLDYTPTSPVPDPPANEARMEEMFDRLIERQEQRRRTLVKEAVDVDEAFVARGII
ncbi:uncharacterized protein LOC130732230 [Lotus japonicus]|uniref:uncharacterized protein LOC130732230 n=1 Tax=Lotus japonicus TaxID=34305 RepID=UPI002586975E|nr:uncharacterized protein LOC130732230 [Lotus japonicus]